MGSNRNAMERAALLTCIVGTLYLGVPAVHAVITPPDPGGGTYFVEYVGPQNGYWTNASNWLNQNGNAQAPASGDDIYLGLTSAGSTTTDDIAGSINTSFLDFVSGSNTLTILGGSSPAILNVSSNGIKVGTGASASILIDGDGATLNLFGLADPNTGSARITVSNGGTFSLAFGGAGATIGSLSGDSTGTVNLGGAQLTVGTTNQFSTFNGVMQGTGGSLNVTGGSLVLSNGNNSYTGGTTVNGGALYATNTAPGSSATGSGNVVVNNGANVGGFGRIGGNLTVNSGATLSPGVFSTRTITIGGALSLSGTLAIQLAGTQNDGFYYDQVQAAGVTLTGATLSLSLVGNFHPTPGDTFLIVDNTSGSLTTGTFSNGATVQDNAGNSYLINYAGVDVSNVPPGVGVGDVYLTALAAPVPEPSTWLLFSSAAAAGLLVRRMRRSV